MTDKKFIDGLIVKAPREGAPSYVIGKLSIKREELIAWLQQQNGEWINADIKVSQNGNWYAQVDDWKPSGQRTGTAQRQPAPQSQRPTPQAAPPADDFGDDDIPF